MERAGAPAPRPLYIKIKRAPSIPEGIMQEAQQEKSYFH